MDTKPFDKIKAIGELVEGRSFIDVGGLWGTKQEMVTHAALKGASRAVMSDAMLFSSEWWGKFEERCAERGVTNYEKIVHDITRRDTFERLGRFDVVHCTGVLYHVPDVISTLANLVAITNEYLYFGSQVVPKEITNSEGTLIVEDDCPLCVAWASDEKLRIVKKHYEEMGVTRGVVGVTEEAEFFCGDALTAKFGPWWWLLTKENMLRLAALFNLEIVHELSAPNGRAFSILAKVNRP